jgi:SAM-dependent methyltransferase
MTGWTEGEAPVQGYNESFSRIYNLRWAAWATGIAPTIAAFYETLEISASNRLLLDVCCGTGQLLSWFLNRGYSGTGLDSSEHMLAFARKNAGRHARENRVDFIKADAADFRLKRGYGLAVSTFDAMNHLADRSALSSCFSCVRAALAPGGCFIFDMNTRRGLGMWNGISVEETEELFILNRGIFGEGMKRAYHKTTGFLKTGKNSYERFEQAAYNTVFTMAEVREELAKAGFANIRATTSKDLFGSVEDPESLTRAFFVSHAPA